MNVTNITGPKYKKGFLSKREMNSASCRRLVASHSSISRLVSPVYHASGTNVSIGVSTSSSSSRVRGSNNTIRRCRPQELGARRFSAVHDVSTPYPASSSPSPSSSSSSTSPFHPSLGSPLPGESASASASAQSPLGYALKATGPRMDWTMEEIGAIYETPLMELAYAAVGLFLYLLLLLLFGRLVLRSSFAFSAC